MRPALRLLPLLLPLALLVPGCGESKSYSFPSVAIDATVNPDGSLSIVERRTFEFRGQFSFAFFTVEHKRFHDVVDFSIREGDHEYTAGRRGQVGRALLEDNVLEGPGGFKFKATWWFDARDERRTFTIAYRVLCAVDLYRDAAHLLWKFVGEGWTVPTDHAVIRVHLPGVAVTVPERPIVPCIPSPGDGLPVPPPDGSTVETRPLRAGEIRAWGHGPPQGNVTIEEPDMVALRVRDLPPAEFVEGSILFPTGAVPSLYQQDLAGRQDVLDEEAQLAAEANRARIAARAALRRAERWEDVAFWLVVGLPALGLLLVAVALLRDRVPDAPRELSEPPEPDRHPAILADGWGSYRRRASTGNPFRAQLLKLASDGAVELVPLGSVTEAKNYQLHLRREPEGSLDRRFVQFLFGEEGPAGARPVKLNSFRPNSKERASLRSWWKLVQEEAREAFPRKGVRLETALLGWIWLGSLAWSGPLTALARGPARLGFILALEPLGVFLLARRMVPRRLLGEGRERMARWLAFRRYLRRFSSLPDAPTAAVVIWQQYLAYAVALDIADRVEKQVRTVLPESQIPRPFPGAPSGVDGLRYFHSVQASRLHSVAAVAAVSSSGSWRSSSSVGGSSFSSSSGSGGGFSSGGGRGGGGTGGGAG